MSLIKVKERAAHNCKQIKGKIIRFILSEKSNETSDVGAWIFWSIMIGLTAYTILKVGFGVGFDNISDLYAGMITEISGPTGGWSGES